MDTNLYWAIRGTFAERREKLEQADPKWLRAAILDKQYNDFLSQRADFSDNDPEANGHGKRLPYIGWFWRHLDFHTERLPIGDCGEFIGFMANNKWDYPERDTTPEEFAAIMAIIDEAMRLSQQGGNLAEIIESTNVKLAELWDYMQTIKVPRW